MGNIFLAIGDSAGGALAAAVCLKMRDLGEPVFLKYQVIIYPITQGLTLNLPSHQQNEEHIYHVLKRKALAEYITMYIGEKKSLFNYF